MKLLYLCVNAFAHGFVFASSFIRVSVIAAGGSKITRRNLDK
jgi:hypothetical protein